MRKTECSAHSICEHTTVLLQFKLHKSELIICVCAYEYAHLHMYIYVHTCGVVHEEQGAIPVQ